jgi:PleD family two-component response regulator
VIFLTAHTQTDARVAGLDAGAADYIVKPFANEELVARVRAALRTKAVHDGLADRHDRPFSCLLLDIDHFKLVNDTHGHAAGDTVLREAAQRICDASRISDIVGRYGGEEFVVLLPETDAASRSARASASRRGTRPCGRRATSTPPPTRRSTAPRRSAATAPNVATS